MEYKNEPLRRRQVRLQRTFWKCVEVKGQKLLAIRDLHPGPGCP